MATTNAKGRRPKGDGQLRKRPNGRWQVSFQDGADRRYRSFPSQDQALLFLHQSTAAADAGTTIGHDRTLLRVYLADWISEIEAERRLRPSSLHTYRANVRKYLTPIIGDVRLCDLREAHVRKLHVAMRQRGLANGTLHSAHATLSTALDPLVPRRIPHNVAKLVERPTTPPRTVNGQPIRPPSREEVGAVLAQLQLDGSSGYLALRMMGACALRSGEALGLRWSDLEVVDGRTRLVVTATWNPRAKSLGPVKTQAGTRAQWLSAGLVRALQDHRASQRVVRLDGFIFAGADGLPIPVTTLGGQLRRAQDRAGVRRFRVHDLRHMAISRRLAAGDNQLAVSRWAGHSRLAVTADMYGHVDTSTLEPMDVDAAPVARRKAGAR